MAEPKNMMNIDVQLQSQISELQKLALTSIDPCIVAQFIAFSDDRVANLFTTKFSNPNYIFNGIICHKTFSLLSQKKLLFNFECKPGVICLIKPWFLVTVDLKTRQVVSIEDPYLSLDEQTAFVLDIEEDEFNAYGVSAGGKIKARFEGDDIVAELTFYIEVAGKDFETSSTFRWNYKQANCLDIDQKIGAIYVRGSLCYKGEACFDGKLGVKVFGKKYWSPTISFCVPIE